MVITINSVTRSISQTILTSGDICEISTRYQGLKRPLASSVLNTMHYQESHRQINPRGIVAIGPDIDFNLPQERMTIRFSAQSTAAGRIIHLIVNNLYSIHVCIQYSCTDHTVTIAKHTFTIHHHTAKYSSSHLCSQVYEL